MNKGYNNFHGLDLNTAEKNICREDPIQAIQMYRKRTKLGIIDAKAALENELGMPYYVYRQVKERIAFSLFYTCQCGIHTILDETQFKSWRKLKRNEDPWPKSIVEHFYRLAENVINIDDIKFDETDPRNGDIL